MAGDITKVGPGLSAIKAIQAIFKMLGKVKLPQSLITAILIELISNVISDLIQGKPQTAVDRRLITAVWSDIFSRPKLLNPFSGVGEVSPNYYSPATVGTDSHQTTSSDLEEIAYLTVSIASVPDYFGRILARNQPNDQVQKPDIFKFGYVAFKSNGYTQIEPINFTVSTFVPTGKFSSAYVYLLENVSAVAAIVYYDKNTY